MQKKIRREKQKPNICIENHFIFYATHNVRAIVIRRSENTFTLFSPDPFYLKMRKTPKREKIIRNILI